MSEKEELSAVDSEERLPKPLKEAIGALREYALDESVQDIETQHLLRMFRGAELLMLGAAVVVRIIGHDIASYLLAGLSGTIEGGHFLGKSVVNFDPEKETRMTKILGRFYETKFL